MKKYAYFVSLMIKSEEGLCGSEQEWIFDKKIENLEMLAECKKSIVNTVKKQNNLKEDDVVGITGMMLFREAEDD